MFFLNLDLSPIMKIEDQMKPAVEAAMKDAVRRLTTATHGHILEEVQNKLKSTRQKYIDALAFEQVSDDTWIIKLDPSAFFIEEGVSPGHEMIDDLLKQGRPTKGKDAGAPKGEIKTAKDGSRYRVIPFEHNKGPSQQTPKQTSLTDMIRTEMKARKIPYGGIEKDAGGQPKVGMLHSFSVNTQKQKVPVSKSGISLLQGVRVYQTKVKDAQGKDKVKKGIFTFRIVSSKHKGTGKWIHPGIEARKFIDEAFKWAVNEWETKIAPEVLNAVSSQI